MKPGVIPENLAERIALWFGIPPPGMTIVDVEARADFVDNER